ncbi:MAG: hypothetical protein ABL962_01935 [Fimbriimonadaceae bacterium]
MTRRAVVLWTGGILLLASGTVVAIRGNAGKVDLRGLARFDPYVETNTFGSPGATELTFRQPLSEVNEILKTKLTSANGWIYREADTGLSYMKPGLRGKFEDMFSWIGIRSPIVTLHNREPSGSVLSFYDAKRSFLLPPDTR